MSTVNKTRKDDFKGNLFIFILKIVFKIKFSSHTIRNQKMDFLPFVSRRMWG